MEIKFHNVKLEISKGDITHEETDAIVNAANASLIPGGGVDGAIHRAGGPAIAAETRLLGGCPTGRAVLTAAGKLKAKHVIHAVGPRYRDGKHGEADLLKSAYLTALELAAKHGLQSISFPAISTGVYGYPPPAAARLALDAVRSFLQKESSLRRVRFVLFSDAMYEIFVQQLNELPAN